MLAARLCSADSARRTFQLYTNRLGFNQQQLFIQHNRVQRGNATPKVLWTSADPVEGGEEKLRSDLHGLGHAEHRSRWQGSCGC